MKAAVLTKKGKGQDVFKIQELDKPSIAEGEALIKVEAFGLNFADVMARNGLYRAAPPIPSVLGYEVVGTIEEINGPISTNDAALVANRCYVKSPFDNEQGVIYYGGFDPNSNASTNMAWVYKKDFLDFFF